jgi:DNA repair protein RecO (recombination protein O)
MLHTTLAVALQVIRHRDRSLVLKAYTEAFGARAYFLRPSARGYGSSRPQPMARMELVVTEDAGRDMQTVREWRVERPYLHVHADHARGLMLLFAQEVFLRALREEVADVDLFRFVQRCLERIDTGEGLAHLPLFLLVGLSGHLGFRPEAPRTSNARFDLREGRFLEGTPMHGLCMDHPMSRAFEDLLRAEEQDAPLPMGSFPSRLLLEQLLIYFRLHAEGFGQLRSPEVLHALLH